MKAAKRVTPEQVGMIQGLWATGFSTMREISEEVGVDVERVKYLVKKYGWEKGSSAEFYAEKAREAIEKEIGEKVKELAVSRQVAKDQGVKMAGFIESRLIAAFKKAQDAKLDDSSALNTVKTLEMASRIIQNTFHVKRYALGLDKIDHDDNPEEALLEILEMTAEEVDEIRRKQEHDIATMDVKS